jgi:hypothetical protein
MQVAKERMSRAMDEQKKLAGEKQDNYSALVEKFAGPCRTAVYGK